MERVGKIENKTLPLWIYKNGDKCSQKIAIIHGNREITYAELRNKVFRLAAGLASIGIRPGDRIILLLKNCSEFVISFFAIANIGAIAVPLNIQYKEQELTGYIKESKPKAIIAVSEATTLLKRITSFVNNKECTIIGVPDGEESRFSFTHLLEEESSINGSDNLLQQNDVLHQYSSGSTGQPKRITRTHFNLVSEAENFCSTVNMTSNDKILCVVPLFHAHGLGNCMLAANYAGATLVILEEFNRRKVLNTIQEEQITVFPGVPFMFNMLASTVTKEKVTLSSLRLCFSAGAPLPHRIVEKFHQKYGAFVKQLYGSTETGSVSINFDENISKTVESVGLPIRNVEVEIFNTEGKVLKSTETGNIGIRSPAMITGYSGSEKLNNESFRDGYFFPGDMGNKDDRGNLYITGRKTQFVNTGGNKVDPSEIEMLLATHPMVKEVVVVGVKSNYGEDNIKAVIVSNGQCDEREIVEFCMGKISDFKIPRIVEFREEIPKSPLGKVLKKYLC